MKFCLSLFKYVADNRPQEVTHTWQEFCERLTNPEIRHEKDGPLFSTAKFNPKTRAKSNVVELSMLGLDCDHGVTLADDLPRWRSLGYAFSLYTTHSHKRVTKQNPNAEERFRIVLPLATPIPAIYYPALWAWAFHASGEKLDPNSKDASRILYMPAKASSEAEYHHHSHDGNLLDWRELPLVKYVITAFKGEIDKLLNAPNGSRNDQLFKSAAALGELVAGGYLDEYRVTEALEKAATEIGLEAKEIMPSIQSGLRAGRAKPRQLDMFDTNPTSGTLASQQSNGNYEPSEAAAGNGQKGDGKDLLSQLLIKLALDHSELFHDAGGGCFASVVVSGQRETHKLGSRDYKDWLAGMLYRVTERVASADKIGEAVMVLRAKARYESPEIETHVRVAEHEDAIYLDLCDKNWRQVEITEDGWRVIDSKGSPVRFRRAGGMLALPEPVPGGELGELRALLNLDAEDSDNWPLILGWLITTFKPCNVTRMAYPLLAIHGEQGSAKSTTCRLLRRLVDPNKADLRVTPKDERDLAIAAEHGRVLAFDNLTSLSDSQSNALCRLATGGGFATRELRTDEGEVIFDSQRPVILNGIAEVVAKSDLLDRAILIYLPNIDCRRRKLDRTIDREFAAAQPRVLGALLDAISKGLKKTTTRRNAQGVAANG